MVERTNRRELIVRTAARLFLENGYTSTSVRQIADAASMTEAALYYHFKEGKRELFQAAMDVIAPDFSRVVHECDQAQSLREFVYRFGLAMMPNLESSGTKMRWLLTQVQSINEDERATIIHRVGTFQELLALSLQRFIPDVIHARHLAWTLIVASFGYGYLFGALEMDALIFTPQDLINVMIQSVENYQ